MRKKFKRKNNVNIELSTEGFNEEHSDRILWAAQSFKKSIQEIVSSTNEVEMSVLFGHNQEDYLGEEEESNA